MKISVPSSSFRHLLRHTRRSAFSLSAALAVIGASPAAAQSFIIDFNSPGYTTGNLLGQGATSAKWSSSPANSSALAVTSSIGVGDSNGLLSAHPATATEHYHLTPVISGLDLESSLLAYSFQYRYFENPTPSEHPSGELLAFRIGTGAASTSAIRLAINKGGGLTYNNGTSTGQRAQDETGANFTVADTSTWVTVNGVLDFGSSTYTLFVNGIKQGTGDLAFQNTDVTMRLSLSASYNGNVPGYTYVPVVIDNIELTVVPEPTTISLGVMAFGVSLCCLRRKVFVRRS